MGKNIRQKIGFFQRNLLNTYLTSFFLYNIARVLPHAVLTVILINKGMTIGQIAIIQSFYMIAILLFELPSGILTDLWSEKKMYLISLILLSISYGIIMTFSQFIYLCIAWFIYGLSSAAISGSLESFFIRNYKNDEHRIKNFNIKYNNVNLYSGLIGGGIGSFIYSYMESQLYIISLILIFLSFLIIVSFFRNVPIETHPYTSNNTSTAFIKNIKTIPNKSIFFDIGLLATFQIILQLFFQFWQVLFLSANIKDSYFGIYYISFQIIAIFSNYIFKKVNINQYLFSLILSISLLLVIAILNDQNTIIFVTFIFLFLIPFNLYNNQITLNIHKKASTKIISSTIAFSGTISSVVSMIFLWAIGILSKTYSFHQIVIFSIIIFMISSVIIVYARYSYAKKYSDYKFKR